MTARPAPASYGDGTGGHPDLTGQADFGATDGLSVPPKSRQSQRFGGDPGLYGPQESAVPVPGPWGEVLADRPLDGDSQLQDLPGLLPQHAEAAPGDDVHVKRRPYKPSVAGPASAAPGVELLERVSDDVAVLAGLTDPRLQLVVAGWLAGFRSTRTRRAYGADLAAFAAWCAPRGLDVLSARRVQVDLHITGMLDAGAAASTVARRLSALSSFYRFATVHDLRVDNPVVGVRRPTVDPDHTRTVGLTRDEARALVAAADADPGPQRARSAALVRLLLHNGLRVDELTAADITDLGTRPGTSTGRPAHRVLGIVRKGGRAATVALAPATVEVLEAYLQQRAAATEVDRARLVGPLLATRTGGRLTQKAVWELVRRLARAGGVEAWAELSPHSLRHTAITLALDAGAAIRDVQDFAGHRDPRTTRRYDHTRDSLERSAAYTVAGWLA